MSPAEAFSILQAPASEADLASLLAHVGDLPSAYLEFLKQTDGAECGLIQPEGYYLRLDSARLTIESNAAYGIQKHLPQLWMIGNDGGDYGICLHRDQSPPDEWPVIEVPLGAPFVEEIVTISPSFAAWQEAGFAVVLGQAEPDHHDHRLVLDAIGPSPARIASIVAQFTGLSAPSALALIREERPVLLKTTSSPLHRLERLQTKLKQHGASTSIQQIATAS